jgi:hypothetical protein
MPTPFEPRHFFDSTLLSTVRVDTEDGGKEKTGTGFLCQIVDETMGLVIALVSNRHVFQDGRGTVSVRFHRRTSEKATFDLGSTVTLRGPYHQKYVPHRDAEVDLAALIANDVGSEGTGMMLGESHIASSFDLAAMSCGDDVWFVGYPDVWRDELHNLPLVRKGSVASLPCLPFNGRPEFIIDAQAFPGSSGSPVYAAFGDEAKLVGVLAETAQAPSPVEGPPTILGGFFVNEVIGLGIVIRATEISPLLDAVRKRVAEVRDS